MAPNLETPQHALRLSVSNDDETIKCAVLGCGMMGQEHISYITGYANIRLEFLCDPHEPSLQKSLQVMNEFYTAAGVSHVPVPMLLRDEKDLLAYADHIDLLVIASPNYLHTESLAKWGKFNITILVEKPVAVSQEQHDMLSDLSKQPDFIANIWVAMEYRYIPAIAKLLTMIPAIGDLKMVTIRENRYPFLHKVGDWNRDPLKTGDTLVEKCCHFFDLFRLITGQEVNKKGVRSMVQRGLNYHDEPTFGVHEKPIIDAAYVIMPFTDGSTSKEATRGRAVMGNLELCMYAEGSRHQEEIIVTGTKGRLEAYLPENKVYFFQRPDHELWNDRSVPPPPSSIQQHVFDCSDVKGVHGIDSDFQMPTHGGYHYSSTAVEWFNLISAINQSKKTGRWTPQVSLNDGLRAVEMGLCATRSIVNETDDE